MKGLEFLIAEDNQKVALLRVRKHTRKGASRSKRDAETCISNINDENTRNKVRYMLEIGIDKRRVQKVLCKEIVAQNEIAARIGIPPGTFRSSLHHIRNYGKLNMSDTSVKICQYFLEERYEIQTGKN